MYFWCIYIMNLALCVCLMKMIIKSVCVFPFVFNCFNCFIVHTFCGQCQTQTWAFWEYRRCFTGSLGGSFQSWEAHHSYSPLQPAPAPASWLRCPLGPAGSWFPTCHVACATSVLPSCTFRTQLGVTSPLGLSQALTRSGGFRGPGFLQGSVLPFATALLPLHWNFLCLRSCVLFMCVSSGISFSSSTNQAFGMLAEWHQTLCF